MHRLNLVVLATLAFAQPVLAADPSLTRDGLPAPGRPQAAQVACARDGLVEDGSFENHSWQEWASAGCGPWIQDPLFAWGYPAYDGVLAAWLGGFCGIANCNSFCRDVMFDGRYLDWYWMGYVNTGCMTVTVSVDGEPVWVHTMAVDEHTYGEWNRASDWFFGSGLDLSAYCGSNHLLCFSSLACGEDTNGDGYPDETTDNMLIDYVTLEQSCTTAAASTSISTVRVLY